MTWIGAKTNLQKAWVWFKKYWYIPTIAFVAVVTYVFANGNVAWFWKVFDEAIASHDKEVEAIDKAHNEEIEKRDKALRRYEETIREIEKEFEKEGKTLQESGKREVKKYIEMYDNDPNFLAKIIEERFGIKYILPGEE